jgi:hypothetical protein
MAEKVQGSGPIPKDVAARLCREHTAKNPARLLGQCWGCLKASKGDETRMCYHHPPEFRGCAIVDRRFDGPSRPA